jgi:peptidoglycan hydrolase CwlO-like protein
MVVQEEADGFVKSSQALVSGSFTSYHDLSMLMAQQTFSSSNCTAEEPAHHQELHADLRCLAAADEQEQHCHLELQHAQQDFDAVSAQVEAIKQEIEGLKTELQEKLSAIPPCHSRVRQLQGCVLPAIACKAAQLLARQ